jgi:Tfp pilus assembly protein PilW
MSALNIATVSALPSPAPSTDVEGRFTALALVPQIGTGSQALLVEAGSTTATTSFTVVAAATVPVVTTQDTDVVFAAEITADNLVRVWRFSNASQAWSFFDPRPAFSAANTLTTASGGDIVWVNVTSETTFQGATLFAGWNLISLD